MRRRQLLVFTEGLKTEPQYLNGWHRAHREQTTVVIDDLHGAPLTLVRAAISRQEVELRDERRGRGQAYDEIWCMFDVDEHPGVAEACRLGKEHGIEIALSNPCLELWILLHFQDQTAWVDRHQAQKLVRDVTGGKKTLTSDVVAMLMDRHDQAMARAQALSAKHHGDGNGAGDNPSSSVWRLVESIRARN